jgi:aspartyl-tRNA(Asn)/glutamyl-tRNA(Gln) amidotransferase subunit A
MSDGIAKMTTTLHDLRAVDLIAAFRAKAFSPTEVLEDVLAHVAEWEPHIKALYAFDPDGARTVAKASTERWHKGAPAFRPPSRKTSPP